MLNTSEHSRGHPLKVNRYLLRHLREVTAQLTQEKLADEIGVDPKTVERWESGRRQPSQKHQMALERFFNVEPGTLTLGIQHFLMEDFQAGYFGDEAARTRLEWANKNRQLAQALSLIPPDLKTRISQKILAALFKNIL